MLQRLAAVATKESRQIRRDRRTLALLLLVPAFMLALYGYALTFDIKHIAVAVLDRDHSAESRLFVDGLFASEYFDLVGRLEREAEADEWLATGRARAVAAIPRGFGRRLREGDVAPVQVLVDGANSSSAGVAIGYLEARARAATLALSQEIAARLGRPAFAPPVSVEPRIWYNPTLDSSEFLVPGLIGFLLMVVGAVSTSLSVVRELERGTVEQIVVSAARPAEFILGKCLPYLVVLLLTEAFIVAAAMALFGMPLRGSVGWLLAASVVYLLGALGWGLFVSTIARTQQVAFQVATLSTLLPSLLLSDLVFPIASMPTVLRWLTQVVPARHFIAILRSLLLKGTGPAAWGQHLAVLAAFAAVVLAVASRRLARDLERG